MKKLSIIATGVLSLGCLCADNGIVNEHDNQQSKLSCDVAMKFEAEHINKGRRETSKYAFVPSAEMSYKLFDTTQVYVGIDASLRMRKDGNNEITPYIGCMYSVNDVFTVDLGYSHHFWEGDEKSADTKEPYFGIIIDTALRPSLYLSYDCDIEEFTVVGTIGRTFDLSQYIVSGLGIDIGAHLGYDHCNKPGGNDHNPLMGSKDYMYYGLDADLVYSVTKSAKIRAGVAYEGNSAKKSSWANYVGNTKNNLWFNASVDCAF